MLLKRTVALILAVTMLPFADYGQVFAYSEPGGVIDVSEEQAETSNTGITAEGTEASEETTTVQQEAYPQETQMQETKDAQNTQQKSETESVSGNNPENSGEAVATEVADEPEMQGEAEIEEAETEEVLKIDTLSLTDDYVLEQDTEVNHLELNGHSISGYYSLTVHGDVQLDSGYIDLWNSFTIEGNLEIPKESTAEIFVSSLTSQINVKGNLKFLGTEVFSGFHRVSMNVGGDVEIAEDVIENDYISKLNLCGQSKQTVTIPESITIGTLEVNNTSEEGIYSEKPIKRHRCLVNSGSITYKDIKGIQGYTLTEDTVIEEDFILGDGCLNLNGYQLMIAGDFIQESGEVNINGGSLIVEGDYRIQTRKETEGS